MKMEKELSDRIIVGIGEILWDIFPESKQLGGAPANFAYHVSQFGYNGLVVSAIGNDELGHEVLGEFRLKKLNNHMSYVPNPTGSVHITVDSHGIPHYIFKEDVAWDHIPYTPQLEALAKQVQVVCFGSLAQRSAESRCTINRFLDIIPDSKDVYKIFDINLRQEFYTKEILHESLQRCNVLKINDEELVVVTNLFNLSGNDFQDKCRSLMQKYNLEILILTCGINGSYVLSTNAVSFLETPEVEQADTVGAGDSFTAAFVAAMLAGKSLSKAHRLAVDVSAYVCMQKGAMPKLPESLKELIH